MIKKKWEYMIKKMGSRIDIIGQNEILNEIGSQGWELTNCVYNRRELVNIFYFKREKEGK